MMSLLRSCGVILSGFLMVVVVLLWPSLALVGVTVSMPLVVMLCLFLGGLSLAFMLTNMVRRGHRDKAWLAVILSGIIGSLPLTLFAFSGDGRFFTHLFAIVLIALIWILYLLQGLRSGGLYLLAVTCVFLSLTLGLNVNTSYINSLAESQEQRLEAHQRQLAYDQAVAILRERLQEVDAPPRLTDIERRLDLQGLPQVRANALRERLRVVAGYERDFDIPVEATFERGAAARFKDWQAGGTGSYRDREVAQTAPQQPSDASAAALVSAADEQTSGDEETASAQTLRLAPYLYLRALRVATATEVFLLAASFAVSILAITHYLAQLQSLFPRLNPLPVFTAFSRFFPIERSVRFDVSDSAPISFAITEAIRKGEQALILGDVPLPSELNRWSFGRLKLPIKQLRLLHDDDGRMPLDSRFCFEQVWFGRYACQIKGYDASRAALLDIREQLRLRHMTKAKSRHLLNIIWYHDEPPPAALVEEFAHLTKVLNLRFIVCGPSREDEPEDSYDSWYTSEMLHGA